MNSYYDGWESDYHPRSATTIEGSEHYPETPKGMTAPKELPTLKHARKGRMFPPRTLTPSCKRRENQLDNLSRHTTEKPNLNHSARSHHRTQTKTPSRRELYIRKVEGSKDRGRRPHSGLQDKRQRSVTKKSPRRSDPLNPMRTHRRTRTRGRGR